MPLAADGVIRPRHLGGLLDQVVRQPWLGVPVVPLDGLIRRDVQPGSSLVVELATNERGNVFEPGEGLVILVTNKSKVDLYIELIGTGTRGEKTILPLADELVRPGQQYRFPPEGSIKIRPSQGKEEITLFASDAEFPAGTVLNAARA